MIRLGVLGGSFDPIHLGHLALAESARQQVHLDRVIFVPAGRQWRKTGREMTLPEERLAMVQLAIADSPHFEVSAIELERDGPSYTDVTLEALHQSDPEAELFFILGQDALADLPHWHDPQRVVDLATLVVAGRPDSLGSGASHAALGDLLARIIWLDMPPIDVSSSSIRQRVGEGASINGLVHDRVADYVRTHKLYGA
ncbi:MAG TPA: nicotinate-nucleotide adenylyltransferase [Dehalococcoidia bacterium]|nr:nicotinate-nucleotide adenylyltransferase [Dehalococcoidia bacterium]